MKTRLAIPSLALVLSLAACGAPPSDENADTGVVFADEGKEDAVRRGRFETFTGADGQVYFHLLAGNGEKLLASEGYASQAGAERGIASVRDNGGDSARYALLASKDGQFYLNLRAANGQVIASSELYATKANAERAQATMLAVIPSATVAKATATGARFSVFRGLDGKYYFDLRAKNGEIVLRSQAYTRRASALDGTASVLANGPEAAQYQVREAADGQFYFVLTAANHQVIGVSELYVSTSNAERAVAAVVALLTTEPVAAAQ